MEFRPKDGLLSEQPVQHTFNTLLPDIAYIVSVAAINNVGNGHPNITVQTTAEEGTCVVCFEPVLHKIYNILHINKEIYIYIIKVLKFTKMPLFIKLYLLLFWQLGASSTLKQPKAMK